MLTCLMLVKKIKLFKKDYQGEMWEGAELPGVSKNPHKLSIIPDSCQLALTSCFYEGGEKKKKTRDGLNVMNAHINCPTVFCDVFIDRPRFFTLLYTSVL